MLGKKMKKVYFHILDYILSADTWILFAVPVMLGLILGLSWAVIAKKNYGGIPQDMNNYIAICTLLLIGSGGIVFIVRKEFPLMPKVAIKGIIAIIIGVIFLIIPWGLAFAGIWRIIITLSY